MRLAFWRKEQASEAPTGTLLSTIKAMRAQMSRSQAPETPVVVAPAVAGAAPVARPVVVAPHVSETGDLDLRSIGVTLMRKRNYIIMPTLIALVASVAIVNTITPRYKSEARILIDGRENVFLRPNGERLDERTSLDPEAVTSQVQLLLSRDLAREVIKKNKLSERPEFDPVLRGSSSLKALLALVGIGRDPFRMTPEERVLEEYSERLTAYAVDKSRVIVVEFQSSDPDLAARVANSIAEGYLLLQQGARQNQAKSAVQWLAGEIDSLRTKVADAEKSSDEFRSRANLFLGSNNTSLSSQQLSELNTQLNTARAQKSDAETKARLIREMLNTGKPIEASEVLNSELTRRLSEQRVTLRAQLAEQSSTLLDRHPRILELKAQLGDLDRQLRDEASKLSRSFENDAKIAGAKVEGLNANLEQLKKQASATNGQDVQLRALEREAKAQRDLLETYLAKYREATTRETIDSGPSDGRIISRGIVSNTPAFPKKLPIVLISTLATLLLTAGYIATAELLRLTAPRPGVREPTLGEPMLREPMMTAPVVKTPMPLAAADIIPSPPVAPVVPRTIPLWNVASVAANALEQADISRKITVLGNAPEDGVTRSALALARKLAEQAKVVLVDLSLSNALISLGTLDATTPGLADLMLGETSFADIVTRDRSTSLHLVGGGRPGADRELYQSPRLMMTLDALLRVYDHVLLNIGCATDLPAALLSSNARAVLVADEVLNIEAQAEMAARLKLVGFTDVMLLDRTVTALSEKEAHFVAA
jgi:uncharacterized protein involved in exopolysaccharide biosynthesis